MANPFPEPEGLKLYLESTTHGVIYWETPVVLYCQHLSLLKAACGEDRVNEELMMIKSFAWTPLRYRVVAAHSVLLPDSERLAFICAHLRKD